MAVDRADGLTNRLLDGALAPPLPRQEEQEQLSLSKSETLSADAWREYNHTKGVLQETKMSLKLVFGPLRKLLADTNLAQFSQFLTGGGELRF